MKYYLYISLLLICTLMNAQPGVPGKASEVKSIFSPKLTGETYIEKKGYKGEQFFNKDWLESDILLSTGEEIHGEKLKYNGLLDELIWVNTSNYRQFRLDKSFISDFWLKNGSGNTNHFKRMNVNEQNGDHSSDVFVEVGIEGKVSLFIQRRIKIVGEENDFQNGALYVIESLGPKPVYYIKTFSNKYMILSRISKNTFLKLFPERKKDIAKIMNDHHLNLKTEYDLIQLIKILNKEVF
jgi:hypothetical protein